MNEMIKTIKGDVFANLDPERDTVIAHGCNTEGVMGAGIALYIYIYIYQDQISKGIRGL